MVERLKHSSLHFSCPIGIHIWITLPTTEKKVKCVRDFLLSHGHGSRDVISQLQTYKPMAGCSVAYKYLFMRSMRQFAFCGRSDTTNTISAVHFTGQICNISTDSLYPYDSRSVSAPAETEHRVYYYHADSLYKETIYDLVTS